ncbi:MAG: ABC transporter permease [Bifidobacteriaceae bacterium]|nr:ABC transporter permease [Bifidobacteriaceae bacterium]
MAEAGEGVLLWVNQHPVPVTGILAPSGGEALDNALLLSPAAAELLAVPIRERVVVATIPGRAEALHDAIPFALAPANPGGVDVSVPSDLASLQASVATNLTGLMNTLGWVVLALAAMSAATSMLLSIHQRAPEIALRRAVGATRSAGLEGRRSVRLDCQGQPGRAGAVGGGLRAVHQHRVAVADLAGQQLRG